jgi:uncharacterized protein
VRSLLASPLGFLIGISLGALGGGGSILAVPALVYAAGETPKEATTTSLVLVAITALIGIVPHLRAGHVRVGAGVLFGLAGVGGSFAGSRMNTAVDPDVLLLAFAALMLVAAAAMWRRANRVTPKPVGAAVARQSAASVDAETVLKVIVAGTGVGVLTGFFGVGGGFVIVPALVLALRFEMPEAVGTSLIVITINAIVALSMRMGSGAIVWADVVPFTVASLLGVVVGTKLARKKDPTALQKWFVGLLVVVALYTAGSSIVALV